MSGKTSIEWTDRNWPFARGCQRVSPGCQNCYAERMAARFSDPGLWAHGYAERTAAGPRWIGRVDFMPDELLAPLRVRKPQRFFPSTIDPFHEGITDEQLDQVFAVMALAAHHTFQILTKRPARMLAYLTDLWRRSSSWADAATTLELPRWVQELDVVPEAYHGNSENTVWLRVDSETDSGAKPLRNVWLGVSVEDQQRADERIPLLLQTPAAVRWVSAEPLLGPVDLEPYLDEQGYESGGPQGWVSTGEGLDWVVVGGESGPGARPMDLAWCRRIVDQCTAAKVAVFVKQLGAGMSLHTDIGRGRHVRDSEAGAKFIIRDPKGGDPDEWPADIRAREFPEGGARG